MIVDILYKIKRPAEQIQNVTKFGVHEGIYWIFIKYNPEPIRILYKHVKLVNVFND